MDGRMDGSDGPPSEAGRGTRTAAARQRDLISKIRARHDTRNRETMKAIRAASSGKESRDLEVFLRFLPHDNRLHPVSGVCLRNRTDFSQTRGSVPIADRQSVHCVPVIVRALGGIKAEGTHEERSQTRIALAQEVYHSAAHGDVDRTPMIEMSDRGLQVNV